MANYTTKVIREMYLNGYKRTENELHEKARKAVGKAIKERRLIKPDNCILCGKFKKVNAHHYLGYEEEHWLDIQWLCRICHARIHLYPNIQVSTLK